MPAQQQQVHVNSQKWNMECSSQFGMPIHHRGMNFSGRRRCYVFWTVSQYGSSTVGSCCARNLTLRVGLETKIYTGIGSALCCIALSTTPLELDYTHSTPSRARIIIHTTNIESSKRTHSHISNTHTTLRGAHRYGALYMYTCTCIYTWKQTPYTLKWNDNWTVYTTCQPYAVCFN